MIPVKVLALAAVAAAVPQSAQKDGEADRDMLL